MRMTIDGSPCAEMVAEPEDKEIYVQHFATFKIVSLQPKSHTVKTQYRSESSLAYAYARRARILAIPIKDYYHQEITNTQTVSSIFSNYQDMVSNTFTANTAGEYLLLYAAEFNVRSSSQSVRLRAVCDGKNLGETVSEAKDTTDFLDFFAASVQNFEAGAHTLKIQACNSSTTKHNVRNARVVAIPLQTNGLVCRCISSEDYVTNGSTAPLEKVSMTVTSGDLSGFYVLSCAMVGGSEKNGTSYNGYFSLTENGAQIAYEQKGFKDNTDRLPFATIRKPGSALGEYIYALKLWSGAFSDPPQAWGTLAS